jgi:hypothetical protein
MMTRPLVIKSSPGTQVSTRARGAHRVHRGVHMIVSADMRQKGSWRSSPSQLQEIASTTPERIRRPVPPRTGAGKELEGVVREP